MPITRKWHLRDLIEACRAHLGAHILDAILPRVQIEDELPLGVFRHATEEGDAILRVVDRAEAGRGRNRLGRLELVDVFNRFTAANEALTRTAMRHYLDTWLAAERAGEGHHRELREGRLSVQGANRDGHGPYALLEDEVGLVASELDRSDRRQHVCRADRWVAGKRELAPGGKDSYTASMLRIGRREHESRLGIVELSCDLWHKLRSDPRRVGKNRKLITAEQVIGEDVCCEIPRMHWR